MRRVLENFRIVFHRLMRIGMLVSLALVAFGFVEALDPPPRFGPIFISHLEVGISLFVMFSLAACLSRTGDLLYRRRLLAARKAHMVAEPTPHGAHPRTDDD